MKNIILLAALLPSIYFCEAQSLATTRAASLGKGMNFSVWLESQYWFYSTTNYPDVTRFTEADVVNLKSLCFQSIRLPVIFEGYVPEPIAAPYTFNLSNVNVVKGLNYVDSVIKWCADNDMILVIDNHIADDQGDAQQTNYQITDANYTTQAVLIASVWKQVLQRFSYADPNKVFFEIRNEPNVVSQANLRILYQTVIDTIRQYDQTHTLVVGCTGYYDAPTLSASTPYTDNNIIYTAHIYDGNGYSGFCFQGNSGVPATDSIVGAHISFTTGSAQATEITNEINGIHNWSVTNNVPVWLSEFGCTTLPDVYRDTASRCNYINTFGAALDNTGLPWAYWDGYGPVEYITSYDGGTTLNYYFSIFDRTNILDANHLNPCFASALHIGNLCPLATGINEANIFCTLSVYPNPTDNQLYLNAEGLIPEVLIIYDIAGQQLSESRFANQADISQLSSGVYFIEVKAGNEVIRKRFVKM